MHTYQYHNGSFCGYQSCPVIVAVSMLLLMKHLLKYIIPVITFSRLTGRPSCYQGFTGKSPWAIYCSLNLSQNFKFPLPYHTGCTKFHWPQYTAILYISISVIAYILFYLWYNKSTVATPVQTCWNSTWNIVMMWFRWHHQHNNYSIHPTPNGFLQP